MKLYEKLREMMTLIDQINEPLAGALSFDKPPYAPFSSVAEFKTFDKNLAPMISRVETQSEKRLIGYARFPSVDAPLQARENVGVVVARGRMLSSVRPWMRQDDSRLLRVVG